MKMIEKKISKVHNLYLNKLIHENKIKEKLNDIQDSLNKIDDYSLLYEDDSDEYYRDQVFDKACYVFRIIEEQRLENDNALGVPFKKISLFYWKMNKILEKFYKKMENVIQP